VDRLARLLLNGQTSLFLGAGVSIDAGLPSWSQLIELLAAELAISPPDRASLASLNPLEAASLLAARAGGDAALKRLCARIVGMAKRHSPQHALLAGLPFKGCVTSNFDELFELAVRGAGVDMAVLPTDVGWETDRWCLKLHGSVSRPDSLVLTRADYASFSREQAASQGVLQGLLLTQHVLFLGFSMRDENWCRIVETVRGSVAPNHGREELPEEGQPAEGQPAEEARAGVEGAAAWRRPPGRTSLGTMFPLEADRMFDALWRPLLHVTPVDGLHLPPSGAARLTQRERLQHHARSLEIFLDHVGSAVESRRCRVLLNPKYASLLTPRSLALSKAITAFLDGLPPEAVASGPFQPILRLFLRMGLRTKAARELVGDDTLEGPYRARLAELVASDGGEEE